MLLLIACLSIVSSVSAQCHGGTDLGWGFAACESYSYIMFEPSMKSGSPINTTHNDYPVTPNCTLLRMERRQFRTRATDTVAFVNMNIELDPFFFAKMRRIRHVIMKGCCISGNASGFNDMDMEYWELDGCYVDLDFEDSFWLLQPRALERLNITNSSLALSPLLDSPALQSLTLGTDSGSTISCGKVSPFVVPKVIANEPQEPSNSSAFLIISLAAISLVASLEFAVIIVWLTIYLKNK